MRSEKLQDAIGEARDSYVEDANVVPAKRKTVRLKLAAAAACAALLAAVVAVPFFFRTPDNGINAETSEQPEGRQDLSLQDALAQYGLTSQTVESPAQITCMERPQRGRAETVEHLNRAEWILVCTVEEISRVKIAEPDSGDTWYLTAMTLRADSVIRGEEQEERVRVVNAAVTNEPVEFLSYPGLDECREGTRAAFVLRKLDGSDVWTIGGTSVAVTSLGACSVVDCMGYDGSSLFCDGFEIPLTELN